MAAEIGNLYRAYVVGEVFGQRTLLTLGYRVFAVTPGTTESQVASAIAFNLSGQIGSSVNLETPLRAVLPPQWTLVSIRCQQVRPVRMALQELPLNVLGTHAGNTEVTNLAAVITMRSQQAARWAVSNKHIGPIPQDVTVLDEGLLTPIYKALLQDVADKINLNLSDAGIGLTAVPGIINSDLGHNFQSFTVGIPQETVRVMRRRTVRVGE